MAGLKLTPTLLIGLGGTGKDVLLRIRKQFFDRQGKIGYPIIGYLALDTDDQMADTIAGEQLTTYVGKTIRLRREGDIPELILCDIKPHEFEDYFNGGVQSHPQIFEWMPTDMNKYGSTAVVKGAGQNRLLGRLAFFHHAATIRETIRQKLLDIQRYAVKPELVKAWLPEGASPDDVQATQMEVVLVYSLAGGTGAGMFLDVGMMVRDVLAELKLGTSIIIHYLILPEVITGPRGVLHAQNEMKRKVEENAFAALREMEYFALRRDGSYDLSIPPKLAASDRGPSQVPIFEVQWQRGSRRTAVNSAPWDLCYLVGASNEPLAGQQLAHTEVYQMVAEQIGLYFDPGDFGERMRANRSNDVAKIIDKMRQMVYAEDGSELFWRDVSRRFCMFGLAQLQFDRARMKRAAAHRLAWLWIDRWWNRSSMLLPNEIRGKAEADLGTDDPNLQPTVTPDGEQAAVSFGLVSVGRALLRTSAGSTSHVGEAVNERHKELRLAIEEGNDPKKCEAELKAWLQEHRSATAPPARGERLASSALPNVVRQNREELEARMNLRLGELFRYRVSEWGIPDTATLFAAYQEILEERVEQAAEYKSAARGGGEEWEKRLLEAKRIPGYLKGMAIKAELLRAVDQGRRQIAAAYKAAIGDDLLQLMRSMAARVRRDNVAQSYHSSLRGFSAKTTRLTDYLTARFQELSSPEQARAETRGNADATANRQGRVTALLHRQTEAEYDRRIARALGVPDGNPERIDWIQLNNEILTQLGNTNNPRLGDVRTIADLVLRYLPVGSPQANDADFNELARELAEACESLLSKFAEDVKALDEFFTQADTETPLRNLRVYSAPMVRKNKDVLTTREVDTDARQMLGLAGQKSTTGNRFVEQLKRSGEQDPLSLASIEALDMKSDAIVLYREKVGIPLCYYAGLGDLGEKYDTSRRPKELHIHADFFKGKLPEIRHIDQSSQTRMAHALESSLCGIVVGRVLYDPGRTTFSFLYKDFTRQLGSQLEEVARNLTERPEWAAALNSEIDRWFSDAAEREGGKPLALLWAALRWFYEELRKRVEAMGEASRNRIALDHPLLSFVRDRMIPRIRSRLDQTAQGVSLIRRCVELDRQMNDPRTRSEERADLWRQWCELVERDLGRFSPINPDDMPIPVMVSPAV
jgi:hypothetical protein